MANGTLFKLAPLNKGEMLKGIFEYQHNLINSYQSKGKLPPFPLDLSSREDQKFIRKTIGWIIEEVVEASEEWVNAQNVFMSTVYTEEENRGIIMEHLKKMQNEFADILHFLTELFIYCNIEADDILQYYLQICEGENLKPLFFMEGLKTSFSYARNMNIMDGNARVAKYSAYKLNQAKENPSEGLLIIGGEDLGNIVELHNWAITYYLIKAQANLKAKDWKETDMKVNVNDFQKDLMRGWILTFKLFDLMGLDEQSMYTLYENKNLVNQQRILNNY